MASAVIFVSIFALSNRVLLPLAQRGYATTASTVSIFALSNRVLLPIMPSPFTCSATKFQYSLCRIVYCCHQRYARRHTLTYKFQYSLCRIVYCCPTLPHLRRASPEVSIFALSNRVLLPSPVICRIKRCVSFQYSLCRIVYCCLPDPCSAARSMPSFNIRSVESCTAAADGKTDADKANVFQYSLCRIVYCCQWHLPRTPPRQDVSIFALSNRVLLPLGSMRQHAPLRGFNIRSVESCTAAEKVLGLVGLDLRVSIFALSNRVLLLFGTLCSVAESEVSIFALSNRVLLRQL